MGSNLSTQRDHSFEAWKAGESQAHQTVTYLVSDLEEIEQIIGDFEAIKAKLRDELSQVIATMDGQQYQTSSGYKLALTAPSTTTSYDRKALDELVIELAGNEDDDLRAIASRISLARRWSERAGTLRIEKPKRRREDRAA